MVASPGGGSLEKHFALAVGQKLLWPTTLIPGKPGKGRSLLDGVPANTSKEPVRHQSQTAWVTVAEARFFTSASVPLLIYVK